MADNTEGAADTQLSFKVKTSGDGMHNISISDSASVLDLKTKLSGEDYENIAVDRMRLIYSGRVMKNEEPLATYKIKTGNTIHMVRSAASNPDQSSASTSAAGAGSASASASAASRPVQPAVPTNMSAGTSAGNPLDALTGARYAGFTGLPSADLFGPNGGMGAPPGPDEIANLMSNPQAAQAMNEAMNNPTFIDLMIQNNPMLRNMPNAREMLQTQMPAIRQMLADPEAMRSMMRMRQMMEGGGQSSFPAPGATSTTPSDAPAAGVAGAGAAAGNPFAGLFSGNPLMNPFGAQPPPYAQSDPASGAGATPGTQPASSSSAATAGVGAGAAGSAPPAANPFAALMSAMSQQGGGAGGAGAPSAVPGQMPGMPAMNPEMMQAMLQDMGLGGAAAAAPVDNRPPEERYADQLRQLNDMGFTDFDRNITALRRSGGSVQGAVEFLLSG